MNTAVLLEHLRYNAWASRRALDMARELAEDEAARDLHSSHGSVMGTLAHIFLAERMWWSRIQGRGRKSLADAGEEFTIERLDREWPPLFEQYERWAAGMAEEEWDRVVAYVTTTGAHHETTLRRIILHLVNHGSIHRGQVSAMVRQLGRKPVATDMIDYYRSTRE
jgi:uncharacterized damage-inducible protein DinB